MDIKKDKHLTEKIFRLLDCIYKEGYASIPALPSWVWNDYRDLTHKEVVVYTNLWIDSRNIDHPHLTVPNA